MYVPLWVLPWSSAKSVASLSKRSAAAKHSVRFEASEKLHVLKASREQNFFFLISWANPKGWTIIQSVILTGLLNNRPLFHIYHSLFSATTSAGSIFFPILWSKHILYKESILGCFQTSKGNREKVDKMCECLCVFMLLDACNWWWLRQTSVLGTF